MADIWKTGCYWAVWHSRVERPSQHTVGHFKDDFMGHSTEGRWLANQIKGQSHWLSSLKGKKKEVNKNISIYILKNLFTSFSLLAPWRQRQRHSEDRELNQARSKPNTVNRPVRTYRIIVHHYNSTQYCSTETALFNISLRQDQHHISDVANRR